MKITPTNMLVLFICFIVFGVVLGFVAQMVFEGRPVDPQTFANSIADPCYKAEASKILANKEHITVSEHEELLAKCAKTHKEILSESE